MTPACPREDDVVAAILVPGWPNSCDETLVAHANTCEVCRDIVEVASMLREERSSVYDGVSVPAAGQVWWRAAIRARLEATQTVARPLTWLYGVSGACVLGLLVAVVGWLWPPVQQAATWIGAHTWSFTWGVNLGEAASALSPLAQTTGFLVLGAAACLVLAPIALYLALSDD